MSPITTRGIIATGLLFGSLLLAGRAEESMSLPQQVAEAPAVQSAWQQVEAARHRQQGAGRWPDPVLEGMASRKDTPADEIPMWGAALQQPLPKAGERAADQERARAEVALAEAAYGQMAGQMAREIARHLADAEAARQRLRLAEEQRTRTEQIQAAVEIGIGAGQSRSADRLALQTRLAEVHLQAERERQLVQDAESAIRATLSLTEQEPLPAFLAPAPGALQAAQSPASRQAVARQQEARAMADLARAQARPMTAFGLRFEREEMPGGNEDTVGLALMTELPWFSRRYARAGQHAAQSAITAGTFDLAAVEQDLAATLGRVARAEHWAATTRRVVGETQARLEAEYSALVRRAGTAEPGGATPVLMVLDIVDRQAELQRQEIEADAALRLTQADLWRFAPANLFNRTGEKP